MYTKLDILLIMKSQESNIRIYYFFDNDISLILYLFSLLLFLKDFFYLPNRSFLNYLNFHSVTLF